MYRRIGELVTGLCFIKGFWVEMPVGKLIQINDHSFEIDLNYNYPKNPRIIRCCILKKGSYE